MALYQSSSHHYPSPKQLTYTTKHRLFRALLTRSRSSPFPPPPSAPSSNATSGTCGFTFATSDDSNRDASTLPENNPEDSRHGEGLINPNPSVQIESPLNPKEPTREIATVASMSSISCTQCPASPALAPTGAIQPASSAPSVPSGDRPGALPKAATFVQPPGFNPASKNPYSYLQPRPPKGSTAPLVATLGPAFGPVLPTPLATPMAATTEPPVPLAAALGPVLRPPPPAKPPKPRATTEPQVQQLSRLLSDLWADTPGPRPPPTPSSTRATQTTSPLPPVSPKGHGQRVVQLADPPHRLNFRPAGLEATPKLTITITNTALATNPFAGRNGRVAPAQSSSRLPLMAKATVPVMLPQPFHHQPHLPATALDTEISDGNLYSHDPPNPLDDPNTVISIEPLL